MAAGETGSLTPGQQRRLTGEWLLSGSQSPNPLPPPRAMMLAEPRVVPWLTSSQWTTHWFLTSTMSPRIRLQLLRCPRAGPCPLQSHPEQGHVCSHWPPPCQGELCPLRTPRTWSYLLRIPKVDHVLSESPNIVKYTYSTFFS